MKFGLGFGLNKNNGLLQSFTSLVKAAGGVLYLDARKADGSAPLTGNDSPFVDLANDVGKNKFNSLTISPESVVRSSDGVVIPFSGYFASDFIKVDENTDYYLNDNRTGNTAIYDKDKNFIRSIVGTNFTFATISGDYYVKFSALNANLNICQLEKGTVPTPYEPYTRNDGKLTNFAGTVTSGWQATPNVLRFDGVDDFVAFADTASLDITNAPLAIGVTVRVPDIPVASQYFVTKNLTAFADIQYGIIHATNRSASFIKNGVTYAGFTSNSANYVNMIFYWDGVNVTAYENGIQKAQSALVGPLTSSGTLILGNRNGGSNWLDGDVCTQTIYTGSDINKILKAEAKISAEYLALNP